ncbi:hypothetical protein LOTGIDRAFT_116536 [Lottia gigantea]|uniref:SET domain-containing protein n=1 Tax=Lottia gigantea TaxID=225164 RepID=V4C2G5_LOTGI|nr:hypothetical protein LOTGIDRAFT_116536 [Lottia gigantea]ESO95699.1 hypothetical protein LOTGIDRAFT_116536 [Lottia gigantea]
MISFVFQYIKTNIPGPNLDLELFEEEYAGCDCQKCDQIDFHLRLCSCITTTGLNYRDNKLLSEIFENVESKPILECNSNCSCSKTCHNRLVQKGIQIKLEVFDAGIKGLGLRTLEIIPRGTFVCEYAGEILTKSEAAKRCQNLLPSDMNYLMVLQEHCSSGLLQTFVDPKFKGNIGRWLNHSCQPNLTMFPVRINISVPRLALFANRDIKPLEELTFNYGVSAQLGARVSANRKKCFCGSKDCQELLPFDAGLCS